MKKIVSMLAVAALTLTSVFAVDITAEYATKGTFYTEKSTKAAGATKSTVDSKTFLDQKGYDDSAANCITFTASGDIGGVCLDVDADARDISLTRDQIYGWMNFGNIQLTTGAWTSRYVNRIKTDANNWADADFEKFKPGIVLGADGKDNKAAYDVDNLTAIDTTQKLATALAYTLRPNDSTYFMIKGVAVQNKWGGTGRFDSDKKYAAGDYDLMFNSSFAGEIAFRVDDVIDINFVAKSQVRDQLIAALFIRPMMVKGFDLLVGATYATTLEEKPETIDSRAYAYGVDLRARIALSDNLAITTMNNLSSSVEDKAKNMEAGYTMSLWNMLSIAYKASQALTIQVTGENYTADFRTVTGGAEAKANKRSSGSDFSVLGGVVYSLNENAKFSAGVKYECTNAFYDDAEQKSTFSIPFVFDVAL